MISSSVGKVPWNLISLCNPLEIRLQIVRFGRQTFKDKIARVTPWRIPTKIALDHFDFYYGPMFVDKWPSIRLALLMPHKYVAILNKFSSSFRAHEEMLREYGAFELITELRESSTYTGTRSQLKTGVENPDTKLIENQRADGEPEFVKGGELIKEIERRDVEGLLDFKSSEGSFTRNDQLMGVKSKSTKEEIVITGFEGQIVHLLKQNDFITYPEALKLYVFPRSSMSDFPIPPKDSNRIPGWWLVDGSSIVPVLALDLCEGDSVLDMCAAPGGKSFQIAQTGLVDNHVCNDHKLSRLGDLKRSLSLYIPADSPESKKLLLKRKDAASLSSWDELGLYDKVLADVACTTDRHSLTQDELNIFSTLKTSDRLNLPFLQTRLLINALRSVRTGGCVVYSTCTLSSVQNEGVVESAVAIASEHYNIETIELTVENLMNDLNSSGLFEIYSKCRRGFAVLPFLPSNFGPLYICKLLRVK